MANIDKMDPDVCGLFKAFFEAGINIGLGYVVDPDDLNELFERFVLINSSDLEKVRLYRV